MGTADNHTPQRYASLEVVAKFLGKTPKAVSKMVERRCIPFKKLGVRLLFDLTELQRWADCLPGVTAEEALNRSGGPGSKGL